MIDAEWVRAGVEVIGLGWVIFNQIRTDRKVEQVHLATNSMKDALVKVTEEEALARGKLEGAAALNAETAAAAVAKVLDTAADKAAAVLQTAAKKAE